jgi:hypothetical protein
MIAGTMPKWQQYVHRAPVVVLAALAVLIWWGFHTAPSREPQEHNYFTVIFLKGSEAGILVALGKPHGADQSLRVPASWFA